MRCELVEPLILLQQGACRAGDIRYVEDRRSSPRSSTCCPPTVLRESSLIRESLMELESPCLWDTRISDLRTSCLETRLIPAAQKLFRVKSLVVFPQTRRLCWASCRSFRRVAFAQVE